MSTQTCPHCNQPYEEVEVEFTDGVVGIINKPNCDCEVKWMKRVADEMAKLWGDDIFRTL